MTSADLTCRRVGAMVSSLWSVSAWRVLAVPRYLGG
jgi:hypothetical protein